MSLDVEIYLKNLIKFFKQNPNDLLNLIPIERENEFYSKIRERAEENFKKGKEITLSHSQMIEICLLLTENSESEKNKIKKPFWWTKFGIICLN